MTEGEKLNLAFSLGKAYKSAENGDCKSVLLYLDSAMGIISSMDSIQGWDVQGRPQK